MIRFAKTCAVAAALAAMVSAARAQEPSLHRGEMLARVNCATCHAVGATGDSPYPGAPPFRELGQRYPLDDLQEALAEGIISGHPAMPELRFSADDVKALIGYLKSIQTHTQAAAPGPRGG
ncbi:MAG: cytochrome c [Caulobacteraceae bacterium]